MNIPVQSVTKEELDHAIEQGDGVMEYEEVESIPITLENYDVFMDHLRTFVKSQGQEKSLYIKRHQPSIFEVLTTEKFALSYIQQIYFMMEQHKRRLDDAHNAKSIGEEFQSDMLHRCSH